MASSSFSQQQPGPSVSQPQMTHAHPAFPPLIASHSKPQPRYQTPTTPLQVTALINNVKTLDSVIHDLIPALNEVAKGGGKKGQNEKDKSGGRGEEILACFDEDLAKVDPANIHHLTAGLVYIVSARLQPQFRDQPTYNAVLFDFALNLCANGDRRQLGACAGRLGVLAWGILQIAKALKAFDRALPALYALIACFPRTALSGVHAAFLEGVLCTRSFEHTQLIMDGLYIDMKTANPTYLDVITFFHHAGLICAAQKRWEKAAELFSIAVSVPTSAASAIQLLSAKRAILCNLLHNGKLNVFPKYTSGSVSRVIERNAKDYTKVAEAFHRRDWKTVQAALSVKEFKDDANYGLLEQVVQSIPMRRILRLREIYSKITINDLAKRLDLAGQENEVAMLLQYMVASRITNVTMTPSSNSLIVNFLDDEIDYSTPEALSELQQVHHLAGWLENELTRSGREMGLNREYLKKQAAILEVAGAKRKNGGKMDEFEQMMAAEEMGIPTFNPAGGGGGGKGTRGVGGNMEDMGY